MKQIHNIFSKKKVKNKSKINTPIIVDNREKNSLVFTHLIEKELNTKFEQLDIGDYIVGNTIVERKTFQDFVASIMNKRLFTQAKNIQNLPQKIVLIEGFDYNYAKFSIHANAIRGALLSIALDYTIPIIFTRSETDTAEFLYLLAKRQEKKKVISSTRPAKKIKSLGKQKQFILEGFPGVGPATAKELLEEHKSLKEIFSLSKKQLSTHKNFSEKKIEEFLNLLQN